MASYCVLSFGTLRSIIIKSHLSATWQNNICRIFRWGHRSALGHVTVTHVKGIFLRKLLGEPHPERKNGFWGLFPMLVTPPTLVIWDRKSHFGTLDPHPQNNVQSYHANVFSRTSEVEPGRITLKKRVHFLRSHPLS